MDLAVALERIKQAILKREVIVIVGLCEVFYEGRASSILGPGERIAIIKSDYSVLIHRPSGYEPSNWQPPDSKIDLKIKDNTLVLEARRVNPSEILTVIFHEVYQILSWKLLDEADFSMYATEEDMKKAILFNPSIIEEGFQPFEQERKLKPSGFVDILGVDSSGRLTVVEIKRRKATVEDINQLVQYANSVEREFGVRPRAIIVAPGVQRSAVRAMHINSIEFRCLTPKKSAEILRKKAGLDRYAGLE
ncbi:MAG: endonuclease NucS [Nitrososphaerota archaeon]